MYSPPPEYTLLTLPTSYHHHSPDQLCPTTKCTGVDMCSAPRSPPRFRPVAQSFGLDHLYESISYLSDNESPPTTVTSCMFTGKRDVNPQRYL